MDTTPFPNWSLWASILCKRPHRKNAGHSIAIDPEWFLVKGLRSSHLRIWLEDARARDARILGEIIGYGISTDNHHLTQPDPSGSGPRRAMEQALHSAGRSAEEVNYINAHGTATPFNDAAEGKAIAELFGSIPVSSSKSMIGHSLGAAGAIEAVVCLLALQAQLLPPNINFRRPDQDLDLNIVANKSREAKIDIVLSNSFGFGGTNASILIQKLAA